MKIKFNLKESKTPGRAESIAYAKWLLSKHHLQNVQITGINKLPDNPNVAEVHFQYKSDNGEILKNTVEVWYRENGTLYGEW